MAVPEIQNIRDLPESRRLHKVGNGGHSKSFIIPKRVLTAWTRWVGGEIEEVDIYLDGLKIILVPKGTIID